MERQGTVSIAGIVKMRNKVAPEPPDVTEGPVTVDWLRKFGVDDCVFENKTYSDAEQDELRAEANKLAKKLHEKLRDNGVFYVHQLESLSMHGQLNDVLACAGVTHAIAEAFDRKAAKERTKKPLKNFIRSLAGNLAAMESMCVNYGLSAALVLTMTFANFGSVTTDDWLAYLGRIELTNPRCQALALRECEADPLISLESMLTKNTLAFWQPLYCQTALHDLIEDHAIDLTEPTTEYPHGRGCCIGAVKCAINASWNVELAFTLGCGGGTALLLLVVMYTSWLYITLNATKANRSRWSEARLLTKRLSNHFIALQVLFIVGILLAYLGVYAVVSMKTTTYNLSMTCSVIIFGSGIFMTAIACKILRDIYLINARIDLDRKSRYSSWSEKAVQSVRPRSPDKYLSDVTPMTPMTPA